MRYFAAKKLSKEVERLQNLQQEGPHSIVMEGNRKSPRKRKENNDDMQLESSGGTQVGLDNLCTGSLRKKPHRQHAQPADEANQLSLPLLTNSKENLP
ncbi:hypothetical protein IFM89_038194 [Coptis chinensis]|uniref:Uncharacterized protein n=1 Tax=Coptis chinensis TaxID=261450 RepID=A0A835M8I4_9MAGN|nr:hypothetical protein IFM89_038194 [Coptis chinensis]